ncbi:MAG: sigma-70 family RNA polymerase sigma factor [Gemmatimonadota bacterium]|nr:sigma-70 family RNA polymerase sigma factor [Gemmatimonadota bacterium]MDE3126405.1 sigma-70 family RNA polymerase sigma factor [Gemmatimonadota bacterium]MDE3151076.1 sigma-70 family RNA polymerase sigma factor [Gemmatimonadota bacterium]
MNDETDAKRDRDRAFQREALVCLADVTRYALALTRNEADADDLVQETFLRAYRSWDRYEPGTECRGWLFTICRNQFLNSRARAQREVALEAPELEARQAAMVHDTVRNSPLEETWLRADLAPAIQRALGELPEVLRSAVILVDMQDMKYDEAARVLEVPVGTVRSRLFRGRRLLQEALLTYAQDAGYAPSDTQADRGSDR